MTDRININLVSHHKPTCLRDKFAFYFVKGLRIIADVIFGKKYGHRAIVLETVAAVPGMVWWNHSAS